MHQLREDLNDVQRIMMDNIDDVLQRGAALSGEGRKKFVITDFRLSHSYLFIYRLWQFFWSIQ